MLLSNEQLTINGDGQLNRNFAYIDNIIKAKLKAYLAPYEAVEQAFNIAY